MREELGLTDDNIVMRGDCRIVGLESLRERVLELGHESHQGLTKVKERLRTHFWWPRMDHDIETFVKN